MSKTKKYICALEDANARVRYDTAGFADLRTQPTTNKERDEIFTTMQKGKEWLDKYESEPKGDASEKLAAAQRHNSKCSVVKMYHEKQSETDAARAIVDAMNVKLAELAEERAMLINNAELPVSGLTFTEDGLFLNDVPFVAGKVSDSQIIEVAFSLCVASNTEVQVFKIGRGESLGAKRLKAIADMANKRGFQGFIEQVVRGQNDLLVEEYEEV